MYNRLTLVYRYAVRRTMYCIVYMLLPIEGMVNYREFL